MDFVAEFSLEGLARLGMGPAGQIRINLAS
jgi:hypothetical protein